MHVRLAVVDDFVAGCGRFHGSPPGGAQFVLPATRIRTARQLDMWSNHSSWRAFFGLASIAWTGWNAFTSSKWPVSGALRALPGLMAREARHLSARGAA